MLLVNDHLLKGAGWPPRWLTGKLSDFAFLIVGPVLLVVLLAARLPAPAAGAGDGWRWRLVFVATDVSPALSDACSWRRARVLAFPGGCGPTRPIWWRWPCCR